LEESRVTLVALTRDLSPAIARCELTYLPRVEIDIDEANAQHAAYERALQALGCQVFRIPTEPTMADAVFIEDTAVVLDEIAVITRPGAASRHGETHAVAAALAPHRTLARIEPPGTMDGGDVLVIGRSIFVGLTARTNAMAIDQMQRAVAPFGYAVRPATVRGCLHLKSAVTALDEETLLINPEWASECEFPGLDRIAVHADEPFGANIARVGGRLLYASAFPRTRDRLDARGFSVCPVDVSELAKAEGAVTCCSVIFEAKMDGEKMNDQRQVGA
jgi:dimethylargininase